MTVRILLRASVERHGPFCTQLVEILVRSGKRRVSFCQVTSWTVEEAILSRGVAPKQKLRSAWRRLRAGFRVPSAWVVLDPNGKQVYGPTDETAARIEAQRLYDRSLSSSFYGGPYAVRRVRGFGDACGHASTALKELNAARGQSVRMEVIDGGVAPFPELSPHSPSELAQHSWLVKLAGMMGSEERRKAAERVAQLQPAAQAFFSERRFSATAREIRSWYLGQGVEVGVTIAAGEIVLDPVKLRAVE